jgi:predicted small secreted protein
MHMTKSGSRIGKLAVLAVLLLTGLTLTACNTTRGVGEDIEEAGDEIKDATN